jgi:hypothetical protein
MRLTSGMFWDFWFSWWMLAAYAADCVGLFDIALRLCTSQCHI